VTSSPRCKIWILSCKVNVNLLKMAHEKLLCGLYKNFGSRIDKKCKFSGIFFNTHLFKIISKYIMISMSESMHRDHTSHKNHIPNLHTFVNKVSLTYLSRSIGSDPQNHL